MRSVLLASIVLVGLGGPAVTEPTRPADVVALAKGWLAKLTPAQRGKASLPWTSPNRRQWGYTPFTRQGLALRDMSAEQRGLAHAFFQDALSADGYAAVQAVIARERIQRAQLSDRQRRTDWRHPGLYWLAVFGAPKADTRWSWRLEGHHLSLNLTYDGPKLVSATPWFVGGSPASTRAGHVTALQDTLAREVFNDLLATQKPDATWSRVPGDIDMRPGRPLLARGRAGISGAKLSPPVFDKLLRLARAHASGVSQVFIARNDVMAARFSWVHQGRNQYYRIVGKHFAVEYRNIDNHVHCVWRSATDFGGR